MSRELYEAEIKLTACRELARELLIERDAALAVIAKVRELHEPWTNSFGPLCEICGEDVGRECHDQYPCETIRALDG